ncbi:MAG: hypothetical protein R2698_01665 [Microthrixaceae bacterium]
MLLPRHCAVCRSVGAPLCPTCVERLSPPPVTSIRGYMDTVALFSYGGVGRDVVAAIKFANHRDAVGVLGAMLAGAIDRRLDLVTWIPAHRANRRTRGYDQGALLAKATARSLGVPAVRLLRRSVGQGGMVRRHRGAPSGQTGADRVARADIAFLATPTFDRLLATWPAGRPLCIAVVDDVRTTGASLRAAGRAMTRSAFGCRGAGAGSMVVELVAATVAATPAPGGRV